MCSRLIIECQKMSILINIFHRYGVDTDAWAEGPEGCLQTLLHRAIDENQEDAARFLIRR